MQLSGVLLIDKPQGCTSHDVVARIRRKFATKKVGHAGTLDPDVTGLLVLCIGDATRLLEYATGVDKEYEGSVRFGAATDTDDATGQVLEEGFAATLTDTDVVTAARTFIGETEQVVPVFSAVHINGRRAYELARAGEVVEMPVRRVRIDQLEVTQFVPGAMAEALFRVKCSKGTYVRAVCRDWGRAVGVPAHMGWLRRTASGPFSVGEAIPLANIEDAFDPVRYLLPPETAVRGWPRLKVSVAEIERLVVGQALQLPDRLQQTGTVVILDADGDLVCMAETVRNAPEGVLVRPRKVLWKKRRR